MGDLLSVFHYPQATQMSGCNRCRAAAYGKHLKYPIIVSELLGDFPTLIQDACPGVRKGRTFPILVSQFEDAQASIPVFGPLSCGPAIRAAWAW